MTLRQERKCQETETGMIGILFKGLVCLVDSFMDSNNPRFIFTFRLFSGDDYG